MAPKVQHLTINAAGRDKGKRFVITEMSSVVGESWALRVLLAIAQADAPLPEDMENASMAVLAQVGMKAITNIPWHVLKPLLDEMMLCVQFDAGTKAKPYARTLFEDDIEEIATRFLLKMEVFKMHTDFFRAVAPLVSQ